MVFEMQKGERLLPRRIFLQVEIIDTYGRVKGEPVSQGSPLEPLVDSGDTPEAPRNGVNRNGEVNIDAFIF